MVEHAPIYSKCNSKCHKKTKKKTDPRPLNLAQWFHQSLVRCHPKCNEHCGMTITHYWVVPFATKSRKITSTSTQVDSWNLTGCHTLIKIKFPMFSQFSPVLLAFSRFFKITFILPVRIFNATNPF